MEKSDQKTEETHQEEVVITREDLDLIANNTGFKKPIEEPKPTGMGRRDMGDLL